MVIITSYYIPNPSYLMFLSYLQMKNKWISYTGTFILKCALHFYILMSLWSMCMFMFRSPPGCRGSHDHGKPRRRSQLRRISERRRDSSTPPLRCPGLSCSHQISAGKLLLGSREDDPGHRQAGWFPQGRNSASSPSLRWPPVRERSPSSGTWLASEAAPDKR